MDTIIKTRSMFPGARRGLEPVGTPRGHNHELCYLNISIHILSPVHRGYVKIKYFPKEKKSSYYRQFLRILNEIK